VGEEIVYVTREEAEEVWMAWQVGFETDKGKIATAILVLEEEENGN